MPSVSALTDAASNWIEIREKARTELRTSTQAKRRSDKEAIIADLKCGEEQLRANQRKAGYQIA